MSTEIHKLSKDNKYIIALDERCNKYYLIDKSKLNNDLGVKYCLYEDVITVGNVVSLVNIIKKGYHIDNLLGISDNYWYDTIKICESKNSYNYSVLYVGIYLYTCNTVVDLLQCVTCDIVATIDNIYSELKNKEFMTTEYGYGAYNKISNSFHFAPYDSNYMLSFSLGKSIPKSESYELSKYVHKGFAHAHLERYGVCVNRLSMKSKKIYKNDITFYSK